MLIWLSQTSANAASHYKLCEYLLGWDGRTPLANYQKDWSKGIILPKLDFSTVGNHFLNLKPTSMVATTHRFKRFSGAWKTDGFNKQEPAQVFVYRIPLNSGELHEIKVTIPTLYGWARGIPNDVLAKTLIGSLPYMTLKATSDIELPPWSPGDVKSITTPPLGLKIMHGQANASGRIWLYAVNSSSNLESEVDTLWHEHGHNIGSKLFGNKMCPPFWNKVIEEDGEAYVSDYAEINMKEDFADTVRVYFSSKGGRLDPTLRERFGGRFRALDHIFSVNKGGITRGGFWEKIGAYLTLKELIPVL